MNRQLIKPELQKSEEFFKEYWGEEFMYRGLAILPQVLLDYRVELNLSHAELYFIEKVFTLSFRGLLFIKDRDISLHNTRNITTIRKQLKEKGYLDFIVRDNEDRNRGVIYDFSGLKEAVSELVKKEKKLNSTIDYFDSDNETPNLFTLLYKDLQDKDLQKLQNKNQTKKKENIKEKNKEAIKEEVKEKKAEDLVKFIVGEENKDILENIFENRNQKNNEDKNDSKNETVSDIEKNENQLFIEQYNKLHVKVLGFSLLENKNNYKKLEKYLIKDYRDRKRTTRMALDIAERTFATLKENQKTSLKLQDLVRQALAGNLNIERERITRKVPRGIFVANTLIEKVKNGKNFRIEYGKFENSVNEEYNAQAEEDYKNNKLIEEKQKEKYIKKWGNE